jgi:hypothetical protein
MVGKRGLLGKSPSVALCLIYRQLLCKGEENIPIAFLNDNVCMEEIVSNLE